ncbi:MAG: hypothetical protein GY913_21680 [Proteobacteria bacterium]|nr:hypothetical protein [Actinomycetes bacterium]MCP4919521.1 hypothetical protein [Pseudomonadota bacterium]
MWTWLLACSRHVYRRCDFPNAANYNVNIVTNWTDYAAKHLLGRTIVGVRYLTKAEAEDLGWHRASLVIVLDDNTILFPSSDDEGNSAGVLFGQKGAAELTFPVVPTIDHNIAREGGAS